MGQKLTDLYRGNKEINLINTGIGPDRYPKPTGYTYVEMDITNQEQVRKVMEDFLPATVINTAAMTNVDACELNPESCLQLNVEGPRILAVECARKNAHLIHISTDFIFSGTKKLYTEEDKPEPLSVYGRSKLEGEKMVMDNTGKCTIARTIIVWGVGHNLSRTNTVLWAYDVLSKQTDSKVVDDQFRTPTLAEDLAIGCRLLEEKEATGIYNISGKDFMSIYELMERVADYFGFSMERIAKIKTAELKQPAPRPLITGLDISKARTQLGYEPRSFEEGLEIFKKQLNN